MSPCNSHSNRAPAAAPGSSRRRRPRAAQAVLGSLLLLAVPAIAFESVSFGGIEATPSFNARLGLQHGDNINYGLGALDSIGETERSVLYLALKPGLLVEATLDGARLYGGVSGVAATTTLDGELSGQVARSGDQAFDTDHSYVGYERGVVDLSFGAQEFSIGDGFIIGDGNFNMGGEDGQYWTGAFLAWRNSAILKINTEPVRGEVFWLRTDSDFRDGRVAGINIESTGLSWGTVGVSYIEVLAGGAFNLDGINALSIRGADLRLPALPQLAFFGEWVLEKGEDEQAGGRDNNAVGWYLEAQYDFLALPWRPRLSYRYARMSGDELDTPDNEEYRGLYFTIFRRDWDTWYQGEIAGEYHLFNQNQVTQMVKLKTFPRESWTLTLHFFHHELEEPQYFGTPVSDTNWADEINIGVQKFVGDRFFGYVGFAWSTPNRAAQEIFVTMTSPWCRPLFPLHSEPQGTRNMNTVATQTGSGMSSRERFADGCAWIDGDYLPIAEARIPINDTGFTRSDCTYDVVSVWQGSFFRLEDHLDRFAASCTAGRFTLPCTRAAIRDILLECVCLSGLRDAYVEMIVTRGVPPPGVRDPRRFSNRFYAFAIPYVWIATPAQQDAGTSLVIANDTRRIEPDSVDPRMKNFHWGDLTRGLLEAYERDAHSVVLLNAAGDVTEGPGFNVFAFTDGALWTPAAGVLEGITRRTVIELATRAGIEVHSTNFGPQVLRAADELFLTSTAGGVMPVTQLDGRRVGNGRPGALTLRLREAYWDAHREGDWTLAVDYRDTPRP